VSFFSGFLQVFLLVSSMLLLPLGLLTPRAAVSAWGSALTWLGLLFIDAFQIFVLALPQLWWPLPHYSGVAGQQPGCGGFQGFSACAGAVGDAWRVLEQNTAAVVQLDVPDLPTRCVGNFTVAQITDIRGANDQETISAYRQQVQQPEY
jgi:hypothetical protein